MTNLEVEKIYSMKQLDLLIIKCKEILQNTIYNSIIIILFGIFAFVYIVDEIINKFKKDNDRK